MRRDLDALTAEDFDLLVIGGGVTGAGAALDAVLRGLRVALIDKGDFASGTSSVSSKLVHGGLRYLEQGDFGLVYEALHERRRLLRNAPHLVRPLRFILPFYDGARVPPWKQRLGLMLYDLLAGRGNIRRSRSYPLPRLHHDFPDLRSRHLRGGAEFFDAQMDDARLCLEVVRTAALNGAVIANYVEAAAFEKEAGLIRGVRALDRLGGRELRIRARQTLNAAGPWGDAVRRLAGDADGPTLRPTKGVHVLAPGRGLTAAFLLLHPDDGRVFFVIPWLGKTLVGTTDAVCDEPPDALSVAPADADYLLRGHNHYFRPSLSLNDLLGSFVGLRPLVRARPGEPSSLSRSSPCRRRRRVCSPSPEASTRRIAAWPRLWWTEWCGGWACAAAVARATSGWTGRRVSRGEGSSRPPLLCYNGDTDWRNTRRGVSSAVTAGGPRTWPLTWSATRRCASASFRKSRTCWPSSPTSGRRRWP